MIDFYECELKDIDQKEQVIANEGNNSSEKKNHFVELRKSIKSKLDSQREKLEKIEQQKFYFLSAFENYAADATKKLNQFNDKDDKNST